ncbi:MAG: ribonuclease HII [Rhodospirillaceae bacterium]|nr:MAG: ribonuclease HII [Rhodospirillaceae bacterium]
MPDLILEQRLGGRVVGIDEAGRGPWAGPVVAAAVVLDPLHLPATVLAALDDSKKLSPRRREALYAALQEGAGMGIGLAEVAEIDSLNILRATLLAMARAVAGLGSAAVDHALVDGNQAPLLACPVTTVVGGDGISASIAAASIVAKVTRDRLMQRLALEYPGYGWETNKGYGTPAHRAALARLGVTPHHRRSFAPVAAHLPGYLGL